jgi:Bacterial archaeo-eukaryotic release factor family 3
MDSILNVFKNIRAEGCVTIMLNTHRTAPDNLADHIELKRLLQTAEDRIRVDYSKDKAFGDKLVKRIKDLAESIDHQHNLDSLILFVNQDVSEYTRLMISVEARVAIDDTFATRELVRAVQAESGYYVLVLSPQEARVIEAFNDKPITEIGSPFPYHNTHLYSTSKAELSNASRQTNLAGEFYNRVDKELNKVHKVHPLPVVICAEGSTYFEYLKVADNREVIIGQVNQNRIDHKAHHIVDSAWPLVKVFQEEKNAAKFSNLDKALSAGKYFVDINEILSNIRQGRGKTLFVKTDLFLPARMENGSITLVPPEERAKAGVVDDIVDELIEENFRFGGDVVFLKGDKLDPFNGIVLSARY